MIVLGMKKLAASVLSLGFLSSAASALAAIDINVAPPPGNFGIDPISTPVNTIFSNAIKIIFIVAILAVLVMLIWGAFQWITSGGDKEAVGNARKRITHALIGLAILALAFVILFVVGNILHVDLLGGLSIPSLNTPLPAPAGNK